MGRVNFDLVYPVGSIYLSAAAVDPAHLFGGTWEQLHDVFLLAAGGQYALGAVGGEATHKLTASEIPNHKHYTNGIKVSQSSNGYEAMRSDGLSQLGDYRNTMSAVGGGNAHNNMPPYLAVNVWKRTA